MVCEREREHLKDKMLLYGMEVNLINALKAAQVLPNGFGGAFLASDFVHGQARADLGPKVRRALTRLPLRWPRCSPRGGVLKLPSWVAHRQAMSHLYFSQWGYPDFFPTLLGLFKLSTVALTHISGGMYLPIAQALDCYKLGGALYTHGVVEGAPWTAQVWTPLQVFLCTCALLLNRMSLPQGSAAGCPGILRPFTLRAILGC